MLRCHWTLHAGLDAGRWTGRWTLDWTLDAGLDAWSSSLRNKKIWSSTRLDGYIILAHICTKICQTYCTVRSTGLRDINTRAAACRYRPLHFISLRDKHCRIGLLANQHGHFLLFSSFLPLTRQLHDSTTTISGWVRNTEYKQPQIPMRRLGASI
jgi:hypothetical protein